MAGTPVLSEIPPRRRKQHLQPAPGRLQAAPGPESRDSEREQADT